ncbi:MAG: DUF2129 domain-containing protein [Acholeplasmatales bacterium]
MLQRECYIVYYRHNGALKNLKKIEDIEIYYVSERFKYATIYFDKKDEKKILGTLKKTKGIRQFEPSLLDKPEINIPLEKPVK